MSQVTIYLEEDTLAAAKAAAARAKMSLSKWFAQYAEAEKAKPLRSWDEVYAEMERLGDPRNDTSLDFLLDQKTRYADLAPQRDLEPF
jgi:hypothetical protein